MYKKESCSRHYLLTDWLKLFGAVVSSSVVYGCGIWAMTAEREKRLRTTQRKMLRRMLGSRRKKAGTGPGGPTAKDVDLKDDSQSGTGSTNSSRSSSSSSSSGF